MGFEVEIRKNMPVDYVLENGTKEQKAVIKMFDYDSNGVIDRREAKAYNKYGLRSFGQENTVHVIRNGKKESHGFHYNNLSDLDNFAIWEGGLYLRSSGVKLEGESTYYDANDKTVVVHDGEQKQIYKLDTEG